MLPLLGLLFSIPFHLLTLCCWSSFSIISFDSVRVTSRSLYHLQGLKKNWEEVHKEFQSLSVFIDSIPKKIRKQRLEEEMKQLEHDISVIEKHKIIYIANKWGGRRRAETEGEEENPTEDVKINPCFPKRAMKRIKSFHPKKNVGNVERIIELFTVLEKTFSPGVTVLLINKPLKCEAASLVCILWCQSYHWELVSRKH